MKNIASTIKNQNWDGLAQQINSTGYAIIKNVLDEAACLKLIGNYQVDAHYRKTINMERYRFGLGEYKYFQYPLPAQLQTIRESVYPHLAKIANQWMQALNTGNAYPADHQTFLQQCHLGSQTKPTVLILKYGEGSFNTLHQDLYGDIYFPMQAVLFLNQPGTDYTGGEFVLT